MAEAFQGSALPLDGQGMAEVLDRLRVGAAELWAVLTVETRGCGFLPDRRPAILFERHVFSRQTNHRFDGSHPDISNPEAGGYGAGGAAQYDRLERAVSLDRPAALRSASWGIGQVMGFNAGIAGYSDVEEMVAAMCASEAQQLTAMATLMVQNGLDHRLRQHDWPEFARGYNGPEYAKNRYDTRLAGAYQKYTAGPLPDLTVRAAQVYLTYLGFHPGPVDGLLGRFTRSALNQFQAQQGLQPGDQIGPELLVTLKEAVDNLSPTLGSTPATFAATP